MSTEFSLSEEELALIRNMRSTKDNTEEQAILDRGAERLKQEVLSARAQKERDALQAQFDGEVAKLRGQPGDGLRRLVELKQRYRKLGLEIW